MFLPVGVKFIFSLKSVQVCVKFEKNLALTSRRSRYSSQGRRSLSVRNKEVNIFSSIIHSFMKIVHSINQVNTNIRTTTKMNETKIIQLTEEFEKIRNEINQTINSQPGEVLTSKSKA
jgi:hypothetical protein